MKTKNVHIFSGGTVAHITNHFAVCAPAYGTAGRTLARLCSEKFTECNIVRNFTKMAAWAGTVKSMETNEDVAKRIEELKADLNTKVIFFNCALVDYKPYAAFAETKEEIAILNNYLGKNLYRLDSKKFTNPVVKFTVADKIISTIRNGRKDIFLVGFKTTCGASKQQMFEKGLALCKGSSVNLVLVNDTKTHWNMIVTPEEAAYHETDNREDVLKNLVEMAWYRSQLTFTQSTVIAGTLVGWDSALVPESLRTIVDHCVNGKAYKVFNGGTVGHFATAINETEFLTSIRKSNFNDLDKVGLVYVKTDGPDTVLAYGAKPSVGGQSQRIVFRNHPGFDAIVHFHCPLRSNHPDAIPIVSQREVECGSHQCGKNTSDNLKQFGNLKCVMLDQHGPNIVFPKNINPQEVVDFIERNFDLTKKTGGYTLPT